MNLLVKTFQQLILLLIFLLALAPTPAGAGTLRAYADSCGIKVGTAVVWSAFNGGPAIYRTTLAQEFNLLECENETKFAEVHPAQNTYNYTKADQVIAFAQANGQAMRGHVLAWHQDNPGWLTGGGFNSAQLTTILQNHVQTVLGYFDGKMYAWDIVNEAFNEDGSRRSSIWSDSPGINTPDATGPAATRWIEQVFIWARAADPDLELYYNDYNNELSGYAKGDAVYAMAQDFVNRGVPIDGIGMQVHVVAGAGFPNPAQVRNQINRITALGLKVEITELDIRIQQPTDATKLAQQAATGQAIIDACLDNPLCTTIQWWGHTDNYSWIPGTFPGYDDALLLDRSYNKKPIYDTFLAELQSHCGAPGSPTPTPTVTPVPVSVLFDDFEDVDTTNNWGGDWSPYAGGGSAINFVVNAPGAPASTAGKADVTGTLADYAGLSADLKSGGGVVDLSNYIGLRFKVRGNGTDYRFQLASNSVTTGAHWGQTFASSGAWTTVTLYFSDFTQPGWAPSAEPLDLAQAINLQWTAVNNGAIDFEIDDVELLTYNPPTVTPTLTRTMVPPTATRTATRTVTPTATRTATRTSSPTVTPVSTATLTYTLTPVPPTATFTHTLTPVPSTVTFTSTLTPQPPTATFTSTLTSTAPTLTSTAVNTFTVTPVDTLTPSATITPTFTPVATNSTETFTPTVTDTFTLTPQDTATLTPQDTAISTFTVTPQDTATLTSVNTVTPTWTPTATLTFAPTFSGTSTWTLTASETHSPTSTWTPTATSTHSSTSTSTPTPASTPPPTLPATLTSTPPPTLPSTLTFTFTPTVTAVVPSISGLDLSQGALAGGEVVRISGNNFDVTAGVEFDGVPAVDIVWIDASTLQVVVPGHEAATVDVRVINADGASATLVSGYTYVMPAGAGGSLEIESALMAPNPITGPGAAVWLNLKGRADGYRWTCYSTGMTLVRSGQDDQLMRAGWNSIQLDLDGLSNGTWYVVVRVKRDSGAESTARTIKVMLLK